MTFIAEYLLLRPYDMGLGLSLHSLKPMRPLFGGNFRVAIHDIDTVEKKAWVDDFVGRLWASISEIRYIRAHLTLLCEPLPGVSLDQVLVLRPDRCLLGDDTCDVHMICVAPGKFMTPDALAVAERQRELEARTAAEAQHTGEVAKPQSTGAAAPTPAMPQSTEAAAAAIPKGIDRTPGPQHCDVGDLFRDWWNINSSYVYLNNKLYSKHDLELARCAGMLAVKVFDSIQQTFPQAAAEQWSALRINHSPLAWTWHKGLFKVQHMETKLLGGEASSLKRVTVVGSLMRIFFECRHANPEVKRDPACKGINRHLKEKLFNLRLEC